MRDKHQPASTSSARERRRKARTKNTLKSSITLGTDANLLFKPLAEHDLQKIHSAALDLLERVGMANATPRVLEVATAHGCKVDTQGRLLFPRMLVEDVLDKAAKHFIVHGRDPAFAFEARNNRNQLPIYLPVYKNRGV